MIYLTQLIYIKEGKEDIFNEFEAIAIPSITKYNGQLLMRIRPNENSIIELNIAKPYEVHIVTFNSELDFQNFLQDEERKKFLHLKEASIQSSILVKGIQL